MGWTYTNRGSKTTREFFEDCFNYDKPEEGKRGKIIAYSATWTTAYMAYEVLSPDQSRKVIGLVCLIRYVPKAKDGFTFGYKDMDEDMGPCESRCPKTILDMLTPTTSEYAIEWRKRCWAHIEKKLLARRIKRGDWVRFKEAISFVSGAVQDTFQWVSGSTFQNGLSRFRISRWKEREYQKISLTPAETSA